jgi:hypothetical protein
MKKLLFTLFAFGALSFAALASININLIPAANAQTVQTIAFDIAIDGRTFRTGSGVNPFAMPPPVIPRGTTLVLNGKIFPSGTVHSGTQTNDPNGPGNIGDFYCRGTFVNSFADIIMGAQPEVMTTQLYRFSNGDQLVTEGVEGGGVWIRAVTGGTGAYRGASGDMRYERVGTNSTGDFNIRVVFTLNMTTQTKPSPQ